MHGRGSQSSPRPTDSIGGAEDAAGGVAGATDAEAAATAAAGVAGAAGVVDATGSGAAALGFAAGAEAAGTAAALTGEATTAGAAPSIGNRCASPSRLALYRASCCRAGNGIKVAADSSSASPSA